MNATHFLNPFTHSLIPQLKEKILKEMPTINKIIPDKVQLHKNNANSGLFIITTTKMPNILKTILSRILDTFYSKMINDTKR